MLELTNPVICVVGPTASGKSDVAQELACALNGEVVSADSMQIYRGMDIGTGKVMPDERRVPHYGIDLVDPGEPYSAALFQDYARSCFADIDARGCAPILCGGTGFYVRAAIDAYEFPEGEQVDNPVRERYLQLARDAGEQAVWDELNRLDPKSAAVVHPNNVKRVIRALELLELGESYAEQVEKLRELPQAVPARFVGLRVDPEVLKERIYARVDGMVERGLIEEVRGLLGRGYREGVTAQQAIGYKEIVAALDGDCTMEEAVESIKIATRRYAKRQRSWFRQDKRIMWVDADSGDASAIARACLDALGR